MAEPATKKMLSSMMSGWSQLPEDLLHLISKNLEKYFLDVVHARSVCSSWRSAFPFPSSLLRPTYSLPTYKSDIKDLLTLEKVPLFLFRVKTPPAAHVVLPCCEYFLGALGRDESVGLLPSPLQCSMKVKTPGSDPILMNMLDCQIIPLGHKYRLIDWETSPVAFLPVDQEVGEGAFVVLRSCYNYFMVYASVEKRWKRVKKIPHGIYGKCSSIVTFRGRFYAALDWGNVFVIDPYSLEVTLLLPPPQDREQFLVPCGNDQLFLVGTIIPSNGRVSKFGRLACRVSRLDEEAGTWVEVSNVGDRVLFMTRHLGNFSCLAEELPHGCGLTANSILFTHLPSNIAFPFQWKNREVKLNTLFPIMAFPVEH